MSAAADELCVTHGAVSRQIGMLEATLGIKVFCGSRKTPSLTPAGLALLTPLSAAFNQIEQAVKTVVGQESYTLDIACLNTFMMRWLIPRLHRFSERHPEITVRLTDSERVNYASRETCDLWIDVKNTSANSQITGERGAIIPLFAERIGLVHSKSMMTEVRQSLPAEAMLRTRTREPIWRDWSRLSGHDVPEAAGSEFAHYYYTIEAALGGLGFCVSPLHLVQEELFNGRLVAPFGFVESGYTYLIRFIKPASLKSKFFCDWILEEVAAAPKSSNW